MADGSENGGKQSVIHIVATGDFGGICARLIDIVYPAAGQKVTAEYIYTCLDDTRNGFFDKYGCDLDYGGYFHDNENTEKAVGRLFVQNESRGDAGCGSHGVNKLNNYIFLDPAYESESRKLNKVKYITRYQQF